MVPYLPEYGSAAYTVLVYGTLEPLLPKQIATQAGLEPDTVTSHVSKLRKASLLDEGPIVRATAIGRRYVIMLEDLASRQASA